MNSFRALGGTPRVAYAQTPFGELDAFDVHAQALAGNRYFVEPWNIVD